MNKRQYGAPLTLTAELTINKLYDRAPASVWKYVT
ncbi:hypothetical protein F3052_19845 [Escherichia coli]|nr:hypothetical protein F3052_19845 [Escherichia coli]